MKYGLLTRTIGTNEGYPTLVAIKVMMNLPSWCILKACGVKLIIAQGDVFDVSGKETYAPGKGYHGLLAQIHKCAAEYS